MTKEQGTIISLIHKAIEPSTDVSLPSGTDWASVINLAAEQGVLGLCFQALELLPADQRPDMDNLMDWLGQTEFAKTVYEEHRKAIVELSKLFASHGLRMMVLKGIGLSLNYPVHELRPCGDIDIFLFKEVSNGCNDSEVSCSVLGDEIIEHVGIEVNKGGYHHSTFIYNGITVENHRTLMDQDNHKSNVRMEAIFQDMLKDPQPRVEVDGAKVYYPSATLNAVYLLRHAGEHFATNEITMRHVLDLGFFFQKHAEEIDWTKALESIEAEGMKPFYDVMATICTLRLVFNGSGFKRFQEVPELADKVLADIFAEKDTLPMDARGIHGMDKIKYGIQKSKRFLKNRWKYKMVYKESVFDTFCTLAMNRIIKL